MRPGLAHATRAIGWVCVLSTENTGSVCWSVKSLTVNSAALFDAVMVAPTTSQARVRVVAAEPKAVPRPWAGGHKVYAPDATQKCSYPDADPPERISRLTTGSTQSRTDLLFCVRALPSVSPGFGSRWCRPVPSREVWNSRAKADPAPDNFGGGWATGIYSEPTVADAPSWLTAPLPKNKPRIYRRSIK
jgi:hypothetical protein